MRIAVVAQSKGGTGKTTTSIHIASSLAKVGKKVLLIDCDPQGNVASSLGVSAANTLSHLFVDKRPYKECIISARENLDLIPADRELAAVDQWLVMQPRREDVLRRRLAIIEDYDFVILDTAPSFSLVGLNAMLVAREAWVPVSMEFLSLEGLRQVVGNLRVVDEEMGHSLPIHYIIPTFFDLRNKKSLEILNMLREAYGRRVTEPIRTDVKLSEAPSFFKTVFEHSPNSRAGADYLKLTERILSDGNNTTLTDRTKSTQRSEIGLPAAGSAWNSFGTDSGIIYYAKGNED